MREGLFGKQQDVWDGLTERKERRIAVLGSRRSGKSVTAASVLLHMAEHYPRRGFLFPYIAQSRKNAKLIVWNEVKRLVREFGLPAKLNEADLTATFPNDCSFLLGGCADRGEIDKYFGLKCGAAVIDESHTMPWLRELVDTLSPALMDWAGPLLMMGNPGVVWDGLWYELTGPDRMAKLPLYSWTLFENPMIPLAHQEARREKEDRGWSDDHPTWVSQYLGQWSKDVERLVFPHDPQDEREALPEPDGWRYVLGIDVGQVDATAFVLWAAHRNHEEDYVIASWKESGLLIDQIAAAAGLEAVRRDGRGHGHRRHGSTPRSFGDASGSRRQAREGIGDAGAPRPNEGAKGAVPRRRAQRRTAERMRLAGLERRQDRFRGPAGRPRRPCWAVRAPASPQLPVRGKAASTEDGRQAAPAARATVGGSQEGQPLGPMTCKPQP